MEQESVHATRSFDAPTNPPNSQEKSEREVASAEQSANQSKISANQGITSNVQIKPSNAGGDGPDTSRLSNNQDRSATGSSPTTPAKGSTIEAKSPDNGGQQVGTPGRQLSNEGRLSTTDDRKSSIPEGRISAVESKKSAAEGRTSAAGSIKSAGEGRISAVESKKSAAEGGVPAVESKKSAAEGRISAVESKKSAGEERVSTVESRRPTMETKASATAGSKPIFETTASKHSTDETRASTAAGRTSAAHGKLSFTAERQSTDEGRFSITAGRPSGAEGRISNGPERRSFEGKTPSGGFPTEVERMSRDKAFSTQISKPFDTDGTMTTMDDTVHYMSPVSPISMRSDYEGDYAIDYLRLLQPVLGQEGSPSFKSSTVSCVEPELQRTIAIVKPDAMKYEDVVVKAVRDAGFSTISKRYIHFTPEQVSEFYCQYYGSPAFPHQVVSMSVGPVLVLSLADVNAVAKWRDMVGPDRDISQDWFVPMCLRVRFGLHEPIPNAVHASESLEDANKENRYIYPRNVLEPFIQEPNKVTDYCGKFVNPTLLDGLTALVKTKPIDPIMYLAEWLLRNNPYQPQFSKDINLLPT